MAWKGSKRDYKSRWQPQEDTGKTMPAWAWQALVALLVFFIILGASQSGVGMAQDVVTFARNAVQDDMTYDDVKTWIANLPETVSTWLGVDLGNFWAKGVIGKKSAFIWPCEGEVTSYFGWRPNTDAPGMSLHQGIDIAAQEGTNVVSTADGIITGVRQSESYGLVVEIEHSQDFSSVYGHLGSVSVVKDQKVKKGESIGSVGESGNATSPHLHFEIRKDGLEIDPMTLLPPKSKVQ